MRKVDEGGRGLDETIGAEVQTVTNILNQLRSKTRQEYVSAGGGYGEYVVGSLVQPPPPQTAAPVTASTNATPSQTTGPA